MTIQTTPIPTTRFTTFGASHRFDQARCMLSLTQAIEDLKRLAKDYPRAWTQMRTELDSVITGVESRLMCFQAHVERDTGSYLDQLNQSFNPTR